MGAGLLASGCLNKIEHLSYRCFHCCCSWFFVETAEMYIVAQWKHRGKRQTSQLVLCHAPGDIAPNQRVAEHGASLSELRFNVLSSCQRPSRDQYHRINSRNIIDSRFISACDKIVGYIRRKIRQERRDSK